MPPNRYPEQRTGETFQQRDNFAVVLYGTGAAPHIADSGNYGIVVMGNYQIIDGFQVTFHPVAKDPANGLADAGAYEFFG
jgi:hypothetical protein